MEVIGIFWSKMRPILLLPIIKVSNGKKLEAMEVMALIWSNR
jgi:hypothetical protein